MKKSTLLLKVATTAGFIAKASTTQISPTLHRQQNRQALPQSIQSMNTFTPVSQAVIRDLKATRLPAAWSTAAQGLQVFMGLISSATLSRITFGSGTHLQAQLVASQVFPEPMAALWR